MGGGVEEGELSDPSDRSDRSDPDGTDGTDGTDGADGADPDSPVAARRERARSGVRRGSLASWSMVVWRRLMREASSSRPYRSSARESGEEGVKTVKYQESAPSS